MNSEKLPGLSHIRPVPHMCLYSVNILQIDSLNCSTRSSVQRVDIRFLSSISVSLTFWGNLHGLLRPQLSDQMPNRLKNTILDLSFIKSETSSIPEKTFMT